MVSALAEFLICQALKVAAETNKICRSKVMKLYISLSEIYSGRPNLRGMHAESEDSTYELVKLKLPRYGKIKKIELYMDEAK